MSASTRQRRYKARRKRGLVCIKLEVDPATLGDVLRQAGTLTPWAEDDAEILERALEQLIRNLAANASPGGD